MPAFTLDYTSNKRKVSINAPTAVRPPSKKEIGPSSLTSSLVSDEPDPRAAEIASKRAWDVAMGPAKQVPMQAFVLWMSGASVHIVSLVSLFMLAISSLKGIASTKSAFAHLRQPGADISLQTMVFAAGQGALFCLALYKANSIGLLPTQTSDWLAFVPQRTPLQVSEESLSQF